MSQNQSTSDKSTQTGDGASPAKAKTKSPRRGTSISRLQGSAGNQAVTELIPVQRSISAKLDASSPADRFEDEFLGHLGNLLKDEMPSSPVLDKLLQFSTGTTGTTGSKTPGSITPDGKPKEAGSKKVKADTIEDKKAALLKLQQQNAGTYQETEAEKLQAQIDEQQKIKDKADAEKKRSKDLADKQADLALEKRLSDTPFDQLSAADKEEFKLRQAEKKLKKDQDKQAERQKLLDQEADSRAEWGALAKNPNPKGYGELPGETQAAYDKSQSKLRQLGKTQTASISSGKQLSLAKRLRRSAGNNL